MLYQFKRYCTQILTKALFFFKDIDRYDMMRMYLIYLSVVLFVCLFVLFFVPHENSSLIWIRPRLCLNWIIPYAFITWCKIATILDIELWYLNEINYFFQFLRPVDQLIYSFKISFFMCLLQLRHCLFFPFVYSCFTG